MRISITLLSFLVFLLIQSCKTVEPMTIEHAHRIEYGSFGGFAGSYTEHKVVPDGHAWRQERLKGPSNRSAYFNYKKATEGRL